MVVTVTLCFPWVFPPFVISRVRFRVASEADKGQGLGGIYSMGCVGTRSSCTTVVLALPPDSARWVGAELGHLSGSIIPQ